MKREPRNLPAAAPQSEWLTVQLRDAELSAEYLNAALAEGDQAAFMLALRNVAKARGGVAAVARHAGMNRVALSRALSGTSRASQLDEDSRRLGAQAARREPHQSTSPAPHAGGSEDCPSWRATGGVSD